MGKGGVSQQSVLTDDQQSLLHELAQVIYPQLGKGVEAYGGTLVPEFSPLQQSALGMINDQQQTPLYGAQQGALMGALSGKPAWDVSPEQYMQQYGDLASQPIMHELTNKILPQIGSQYGSFQTGGALATATGEAVGTAGAQMAGQRAEFLQSGLAAQQASREAAADRAVTAAPLAGEAMLDPIRTALAGGEIEANRDSALLQEDYWKYQQEQPYNNPYVDKYAPLTLGVPSFSNVREPGGLASFFGK